MLEAEGSAFGFCAFESGWGVPGCARLDKLWRRVWKGQNTRQTNDMRTARTVPPVPYLEIEQLYGRADAHRQELAPS